jgi:two-component system response regulator QseB
MTADERTSLLLIEDDPVLGPLIAELLEPDYRIKLAANGRDGLHLGLTQTWDVMVIDRGLPGLDGIALVSALRSKGVSTPILILTALGATDEKVLGLDAGANDYMVKPFDAEELGARLRALTRVYGPARSAVTIGDWEINPGTRSVRSVYGILVSLTAKENDLLATLAADPGRVFSREELRAAVFSPTDQPGLIDTHVHHLRRKISKSVVRTVHGVGYQLGDGRE